MSNNATVVVFWKKQGVMVSRMMYILAQEIVAWAELHMVTLTERYILGDGEHLNRPVELFRPGPSHLVVPPFARYKPDSFILTAHLDCTPLSGFVMTYELISCWLWGKIRMTAMVPAHPLVPESLVHSVWMLLTLVSLQTSLEGMVDNGFRIGYQAKWRDQVCI